MLAGKYDIKKLQNERMNEFIKASIVLSLKKTNSCHHSYRRFDLQKRQMEGFTVADVILVVGQTRQNLQ